LTISKASIPSQRRIYRRLQVHCDDKRVTNDPMEATYIGFEMWVKVVEKAIIEVDAVERNDWWRFLT
jgi:hypothetical protein